MTQRQERPKSAFVGKGGGDLDEFVHRSIFRQMTKYSTDTDELSNQEREIGAFAILTPPASVGPLSYRRAPS